MYTKHYVQYRAALLIIVHSQYSTVQSSTVDNSVLTIQYSTVQSSTVDSSVLTIQYSTE